MITPFCLSGGGAAQARVSELDDREMTLRPMGAKLGTVRAHMERKEWYYKQRYYVEG